MLDRISALSAAAGLRVANVFHAGDGMRPHVKGGYVNVPDDAFGNWGDLYYGPSLPKLRQVKSAYYPLNVFTFQQSIPPAD